VCKATAHSKLASNCDPPIISHGMHQASPIDTWNLTGLKPCPSATRPHPSSQNSCCGPTASLARHDSENLAMSKGSRLRHYITLPRGLEHSSAQNTRNASCPRVHPHKYESREVTDTSHSQGDGHSHVPSTYSRSLILHSG
jgi:hypothetical protein